MVICVLEWEGVMELARRDFLKLCGAGTGGTMLYGMFKPDSILAAVPRDIPLKKRIGKKTTICCYCGVGCRAIVASENGKAINIEGDPDHPINQGAWSHYLSPVGALAGGTNDEKSALAGGSHAGNVC
jgi:hypothetical protein